MHQQMKEQTTVVRNGEKRVNVKHSKVIKTSFLVEILDKKVCLLKIAQGGFFLK